MLLLGDFWNAIERLELLPTLPWVAVLLLVIGIAVIGLRKLRERIDEDKSPTSELLTNFREMHHQGDLSDAEFRTIKTALGTKLQQETKPQQTKE